MNCTNIGEISTILIRTSYVRNTSEAKARPDSCKRGRYHAAMRFPRINRMRWDRPAGEADQLKTLEKMLLIAEPSSPPA